MKTTTEIMKLLLTTILLAAVIVYFLALLFLSAGLFLVHYFIPCLIVDVIAFRYACTQKETLYCVKASLLSFIVLTAFSVLYCSVYCYVKGFEGEVFLSACLLHIILNLFNSFCFVIWTSLFFLCLKW